MRLVAALHSLNPKETVLSVARAADTERLLDDQVVRSMATAPSDLDTQRSGLRLVQALLSAAAGTPGASASVPATGVFNDKLRDNVWECVISAMHLFPQDPDVQLYGARVLGMLSAVIKPDERRGEARIVCKHAWHFFEARKERKNVKVVVDAMAVTKHGGCTVQ